MATAIGAAATGVTMISDRKAALERNFEPQHDVADSHVFAGRQENHLAPRIIFHTPTGMIGGSKSHAIGFVVLGVVKDLVRLGDEAALVREFHCAHVVMRLNGFYRENHPPAVFFHVAVEARNEGLAVYRDDSLQLIIIRMLGFGGGFDDLDNRHIRDIGRRVVVRIAVAGAIDCLPDIDGIAVTLNGCVLVNAAVRCVLVGIVRVIAT